jgi:hypothetical protein
MANNLIEKIRSAWNAFKDPYAQKPTKSYDSFTYWSNSSSHRPDDIRAPNRSSERTFVNAIYTRLSVDCAQVDIHHVLLDDQGRFVTEVNDVVDDIFNVEANVDQSARAFKQDLYYTMFNEGSVAVVPTLTDKSFWEYRKPEEFGIIAMRVGVIREWFPTKIRVSAYNDFTGKIEDLMVPKYAALIINNPLAHVMNDTNSSLKRLIRKLNLLDRIDEQTGSGKLDLIIQLPFSLRSEAKKEEAARRKKEIEDQVENSKLGIAYIDATEKITQINRPLENNLQAQIEYLTKQVYSQLGLTENIMNGTANEQEQINYYNRTIEPVLSFVVEEIRRKYLTKTARTQGHSYMFFRDPFKLVPVEKLAELADKMTRNEIMSSNEFRSILGYKPSSDPSADELRNKNLNQEAGIQQQLPQEEYGYEEPEQYQY